MRSITDKDIVTARRVLTVRAFITILVAGTIIGLLVSKSMIWVTFLFGIPLTLFAVAAWTQARGASDEEIRKILERNIQK